MERHVLPAHGAYYAGQVPGVDESKQLSLSNAYALNRVGVSDAQARSIINEYYQRYANRGSAFSEWFSIDPAVS